IVASRVVAPYFGNSVYVWGSLIGVFLAALSLGYYLGGRLSTRWPHRGPFLALVFLAGAATFPIPHFADAVLGGIAAHDYGPRGGWCGTGGRARPPGRRRRPASCWSSRPVPRRARAERCSPGTRPTIGSRWRTRAGSGICGWTTTGRAPGIWTRPCAPCSPT